MQGKKTFICACAIALMFGCTNNPSSNQNTPQSAQLPTTTGLERFVDSLLVEFPNAMNNEITRSMLADTIKSRMNVFRGGKLPFLDECPVVFCHSEIFPPKKFETFDFAPDKNADKVMAQFIYQNISDNRAIGFSILTALAKDVAADLIDGESYYIKGKFLFFPDNTPDCVFYLPNGGLAKNTTVVSTQSGAPLFMIGNFIMDEVSFTIKE